MKLRELPSVNSILENLDMSSISAPRSYVTELIRSELSDLRREAVDSEIPGTREQISQRIQQNVLKSAKRSLRQVINGTGIVLHTGLGRAPLSFRMMEQAIRTVTGYANLELDLNSGKRGERLSHISGLLNALAGSEASLAVNNNAAAVLLALNTVAEGKEVIISRGQLVEIGGSFRIPEVIAKSGAILKEVGTTNRTHEKDYLNAISPRTAAILYAHMSNYRIEGFTAEVAIASLGKLSRKKRIPLIADLGSGALFDMKEINLPGELVVSEVLKQGAHLVTFSGDKLPGGPQAGLVCGKKGIVKKLHDNPLYRALRCDKVTLALLEEVLRSYQDMPAMRQNLTYRLLKTSRQSLMTRAERILKDLPKSVVRKLGISVVPSEVEAGSGTLPTEKIESAALKFNCKATKPTRLADTFRRQTPSVLGYISGNRFFIDLKAVLPSQTRKLAETIKIVAVEIA